MDLLALLGLTDEERVRAYLDLRRGGLPRRKAWLLSKQSSYGQRMREFAATALLALEEVRRLTGTDEWDESDWRTISYNEAWEVLGEDRAYEVIGEADAEPWAQPDDVREALDAIELMVIAHLAYAAKDLDHELHAIVEHYRSALGCRS